MVVHTHRRSIGRAKSRGGGQINMTMTSSIEKSNTVRQFPKLAKQRQQTTITIIENTLQLDSKSCIEK